MLDTPKPPLAPALPVTGDGKILGIELLRFASAIAVLIFHYQHFSYIGGSLVDFVSSKQPFYRFLSLFYNYGFYGVEVFWCISGFIFFWKYGEQLAAKKLSGYVFSVLRISRLYPLHIATLLFVALVQAIYFAHNGAYFVYQHNGLQDFVLQLFMASNWLIRPESFNGPIWSISIEVLVYAAFFLSLRYIASSGFFLGAVALAAALVQVLKISVNPLFVCLMFFYLGCLTAKIFNRTQASSRLRSAAGVLAALLVVASITAVYVFTIKDKYFLVVFTPALIFLAVTYMPDKKWVSRFLIPAGNMTYASYLLHVPIQLTVATLCRYFHWSFPFYSGAALLTFIGITLVFSHWTYECFEMPLQRLMRKRMMGAVSRPAGH
jgi:peptidoglycan/LPS O-acetylase OafA/YrhL